MYLESGQRKDCDTKVPMPVLDWIRILLELHPHRPSDKTQDVASDLESDVDIEPKRGGEGERAQIASSHDSDR